MPRKTLPSTLLAAGLALATGAPAADPGGTSITIYSSAQPGGVPAEFYRPLPGGGVPNGMAVPGYAMVRDMRTMQLAAGRSSVRYTDVAALIDPTTVSFQSLTDPATRVLEQNYQFDLIGMDKLLARYVDRPVTVDRPGRDAGPPTSGTLLSATDGLVVRGADGSIHALREYGAVHFSELPGGLITRPTLVWDIDAARGGPHRVRVTYQTGGITWWADYNLVFNEGKDANSGTIDLGAWVSIVNQSGASYDDARLKLIAGDVQRVAPPQRVYLQKRAMEMAAADAGTGFEEKAFFEFHLYTLGRRTTLPNNSTKQLELFDEAKAIPAKKLLVYYGAPDFGAFGGPYLDRDYGTAANRKVDVYLEFRNDKAKGLGIPLPAGRVRVAKLDAADDSLEFIGEDVIDHTPKDEDVRIKLGSAFDVVGERRQVDFSIDTKARTMEEEIEVKVRNHKSEPVDVLVRETLFRWSGWTIVSKSHDYVKEDARTIHFPIRVAKDGESIVRYRVRYHW
ncbi:MAG: hypothetical protein R3E69_04865 [Steroidobacteraceae bacterium]